MIFVQIQDGDVEVHRDGEVYTVSCCDCGLVHRMEYRIMGDRVCVRVTRSDEHTHKVRKKMNKRKEGIYAD